MLDNIFQLGRTCSLRRALLAANFSDILVVLLLLFSHCAAYHLSKSQIKGILNALFLISFMINVEKFLVITDLSAISSLILGGIYGFNSNFDQSYWRFVGLSGQAGQLGLFSLLGVFLLHACGIKSKLTTSLIFINLLSSMSRVSIAITFLYFAAFIFLKGVSISKSISPRNIMVALAATTALIYISIQYGEIFHLGDRISNLGTGSYRLILLTESVNFSANYFPFGLGGLKDYLSLNGSIGVSDLTLLAPDSQVGLIIVRYGLVFAAVLLFFYLLYIFSSIRVSMIFLQKGALLLYVFLDPLLITAYNIVLVGVLINVWSNPDR